MHKSFTINPIALLSTLSFLGAGVLFFFYTLGNISLLVCVATVSLLTGLGVISAVNAYKGKENPVLKNILNVILIVLSAIFVLFVIGAIGLGLAGS